MDQSTNTVVTNNTQIQKHPMRFVYIVVGIVVLCFVSMIILVSIVFLRQSGLIPSSAQKNLSNQEVNKDDDLNTNEITVENDDTYYMLEKLREISKWNENSTSDETKIRYIFDLILNKSQEQNYQTFSMVLPKVELLLQKEGWEVSDTEVVGNALINISYTNTNYPNDEIKVSYHATVGAPTLQIILDYNYSVASNSDISNQADLGLTWERKSFTVVDGGEAVWNLEVPTIANTNKAGLYEGYLGLDLDLDGKQYFVDFSYPLYTDLDKAIPTTLKEFVDYILIDDYQQYDIEYIEVDGVMVAIVNSTQAGLSRAFIDKHAGGNFSMVMIHFENNETPRTGNISDETGDALLERIVKSLDFAE